MDMSRWRDVFSAHADQMDEDGRVVVLLDPPISELHRDVVYMDDDMQMCKLIDGGTTILKRMFAY